MDDTDNCEAVGNHIVSLKGPVKATVDGWESNRAAVVAHCETARVKASRQELSSLDSR